MYFELYNKKTMWKRKLRAAICHVLSVPVRRLAYGISSLCLIKPSHQCVLGGVIVMLDTPFFPLSPDFLS